MPGSTRLVTYGDTPPLNGSVAYGQLIGAGGFIPPAAALVTGIFPPVLPNSSRPITYGDLPLLNGSLAYGQLIGAGGFIPPGAPPSTGTFTPAS